MRDYRQVVNERYDGEDTDSAAHTKSIYSILHPVGRTSYKRLVDVLAEYISLVICHSSKSINELTFLDCGCGSAFESFHTTKEWCDIAGPYQPYNTDESKRYRSMKHILYSHYDGKLERIYQAGSMLAREEVLYAHFQKRKLTVDEQLDASADDFHIANNIILPYQEISTLQKLRELAGQESLADKQRMVMRGMYGLYKGLKERVNR